MSMETTIQSDRVFEGQVVGLRVDQVRLPDGRMSRREIVEHRGATCMVALDADKNVLLVQQYRKPTEQVLLEVPAGTLEPGESPEECARRELEEETGYTARQIEPLADFYTSPGFCTERIFAYLATDLRPASRKLDEDEAIELVRVPFVQAVEMAYRGEIRDAKTIASLLLAAQRLARQ
ncbi:MAG: NUDIX hydrolase [Chloroflexi bacterium]|nr:NUDIX hydrolase [Chloroflexota bacterium]